MLRVVSLCFGVLPYVTLRFVTLIRRDTAMLRLNMDSRFKRSKAVPVGQGQPHVNNCKGTSTTIHIFHGRVVGTDGGDKDML